jgi:predicted DNA-binding transcriptional regulator AlpA
MGQSRSKSRYVRRRRIFSWETTVASRGKSTVGDWKALGEAERLLSGAEVAGVTGLSTETLAQWRSQGRGIPFIKLSRNVVRYRHSDLDSWLAARMVHVTAEPPVRGT